jgi:hypothetical protein
MRCQSAISKPDFHSATRKIGALPLMEVIPSLTSNLEIRTKLTVNIYMSKYHKEAGKCPINKQLE